MPFDRLASSLTRQWERLGAEASTYTPAAGIAQPCVGLWGPLEVLEYAEGFRADRREVAVQAAEITGTPKRGEVVTRTPAGTAETWEILRAELSGGIWTLDVVGAPRPAPRGAR
jgi:hypothetical protein